MCAMMPPTCVGGKEAIYRYMGVSRQSHHQWRRREQARQHRWSAVVQAMREIHGRLCSLGCRKVQVVLRRDYPWLRTPGRDCLAALRRRYDLLPRYPRRFRKRTGSADLRERYPNRIKDRPQIGVGTVMVSDMTFVRTRTGLVPVLQVMDLGSRYLLAVRRMPDETAASFVAVLEQARRRVPGSGRIIHHSDGGSQYRSQVMADWARQHQIQLSTAWSVYENSTLERVNHTMKYEFALWGTVESPEAVDRLLASYRDEYNRYRPHWALRLRTPHAVVEMVRYARTLQDRLRRRRRDRSSRWFGASGAPTASASRRSFLDTITAIIHRAKSSGNSRSLIAFSQ